MGGFNPPVPQQDSNWEIRVAVLLSLVFQVALIFAGPLRKRNSTPLARLLLWSCYLLADWVADLALGLLLNNNGPSTTTPSPSVFAFWTPFLLLHLGGPDTVTAYALEDNELWLRHLVGLLFELFSASIIFFCSLRANPSVPATLLIFLVGVIKYGERTYSLYSASSRGFRDSIIGDPYPGLNYARLMSHLNAKEKAGVPAEIVIANGEATRAKSELEAEADPAAAALMNVNVEAVAYHFFLDFRRLVVNLSLSHKVRMESEKYFLDGARAAAAIDASWAFQVFQLVDVELGFIYDMMYTKAPVTYSRLGCVLRLVSSACTVSALLTFFFLDKRTIPILRVDVAITYALLLGGLALDAVALAMLLFSNWMLVVLEETKRHTWLAHRAADVVRRLRPPPWSKTISQLNLVSYCLDEKLLAGGWTHRWRSCWWCCLDADERFIQHKPLFRGLEVEGGGGSAPILPQFVYEGIWAAAIDARRQGDTARPHRRDGVLAKHCGDIKHRLRGGDGGEGRFEGILLDSVRKELDESLLLWHIATDLCMLSDREGPQNTNALTLSEYMLYLLIKKPEMVSARAGIRVLYRDTVEEARRFFASMADWNINHNDARRMLLTVNTSMKPSVVKGNRSKSVLFDAVILAKALRDLDEALMWEVVAGVWLEMLMYAATRCRESTHVRELSRGSQFITRVWILMAHMGLGDVYQDVQEGDANAKLIIHDQ